MSEFFDSDIVKEGLEDIHALQAEIYGNAFKFGTMSREDKLEHIEKLTELLEKQRLMYTRISLSKDPVWETVSLKIKKYKPFLNINVFQFKKILREIINE